MSKMRNVALALGMALGVVAAPVARADVIFDYVVTGITNRDETQTPIRPLPSGTVFRFVLSDKAYEAGYRAVGGGSPLPGFTRSDSAVKTAFYRLPENEGTFESFSSFRYTAMFSISGGPLSAPSGSVTIFGETEAARFSFSGTSGVGNYESEAASRYCLRGGCDLTLAVVQSVPEPASMALFGAGLLGLAAVRRRRG